MSLDHIRELLSGRRFSRLVLVVSDLEVPDVVSVVELTGPNLRRGWMGLLTDASPSRSSTSVLCPGSLELCGTWGNAGTDPRRVFRLGGTKAKIAGSFVVSSLLSTPYQGVRPLVHLVAPGRHGSSRLVSLYCQNGLNL